MLNNGPLGSVLDVEAAFAVGQAWDEGRLGESFVDIAFDLVVLGTLLEICQ